MVATTTLIREAPNAYVPIVGTAVTLMESVSEQDDKIGREGELAAAIAIVERQFTSEVR